jgi:hypothetical protein
VGAIPISTLRAHAVFMLFLAILVMLNCFVPIIVCRLVKLIWLLETVSLLCHRSAA